MIRLLRIVAVCGMTLLLVGSIVIARYPRLRARSFDILSPHGYHVGEIVDVSRAVYSENERTAIVFAEEGCGACQEATPVIGRLTTLVTEHTASLVAVLSNGPSDDQHAPLFEALRNRGARVLARSSWSLKTPTRLEFVPTILVVDRAGRILFARVGVPSEEPEVTTWLSELTTVLGGSASGGPSPSAETRAPQRRE